MKTAGVCALAFEAACAGQGVVGTSVQTPAVAAPGEMGFGTGVSVSGGSKMTTFASQSVVVAAGSSPHGPTESSEGDVVWRVRGGLLEFCEWADDGREDCRLATFQNFAAPANMAFLPTIIEPANLARGLTVAQYENGAAVSVASEVATHDTQSVRYVEDKAIWITASTPAIIGAQPVFLCVVDGAPICRALPFVAIGVVSSSVLRRGDQHVPVLWVHAGVNAPQTLGAIASVDMGLYRCEDVAAQPVCKRMKEVER
jgi:hypothetical protein